MVRELWGRGIVPSATSIGRNSRYFGGGARGNVSVYVGEAVAYKKMYEEYRKDGDWNPTDRYIPIASPILL